MEISHHLVELYARFKIAAFYIHTGVTSKFNKWLHHIFKIATNLLIVDVRSFYSDLSDIWFEFKTQFIGYMAGIDHLRSWLESRTEPHQGEAGTIHLLYEMLQTLLENELYFLGKPPSGILRWLLAAWV